MKNLEQQIKLKNRQLKAEKRKENLLKPIKLAGKALHTLSDNCKDKIAAYIENKRTKKVEKIIDNNLQKQYEEDYQEYLKLYNPDAIGSSVHIAPLSGEETEIIYTDRCPLVKKHELKDANTIKTEYTSYEGFVFSTEENKYLYTKAIEDQLIVKENSELSKRIYTIITRHSNGKFSSDEIVMPEACLHCAAFENLKDQYNIETDSQQDYNQSN